MDFLFHMLKGALIGVCSILPGVSGGVLSVVFGVYEPLMAFLAHPLSAMKKSVPLLLPLLLGWVAGTLLLSKAAGYLLEKWPAPVTCVFAGLMVKSLSAIYKEAGEKGRPNGVWIFSAITAALTALWLFLLSKNGAYQPSFTPLWWALCGVFWGLGIVIPGFSPSSIFLLLNTYQQMTAGIGSLDFSILLPMGAALAVTIAALSRFMNHLLDHWYAQVMHSILGIIFMFTIAILLDIFSMGISSALACALCFIAGYAAAYGMEKLSAAINAD